MPSLRDVAKYVRSKNAGPFWVTVDIFGGSAEAFARLRAAPALQAGRVATLYGVEEKDVRRFEVGSLHVLKISFPRRVAQGSTGDADSHAGQYYVPLLDVAID